MKQMTEINELWFAAICGEIQLAKYLCECSCNFQSFFWVSKKVRLLDFMVSERIVGRVEHAGIETEKDKRCRKKDDVDIIIFG